MSNTLVNLARVQSTTLGQGTLTLGAAIAGFNTFSGAGLTDGQTVTYAIEDYSSDIPATVTGREIGQGVYSAGTLTRASVYSSTLAGAKLNCSGRQHVFTTAAAEDLASFATDLTAHLTDTAGAHAASAISFSATGGIASTDVQAAIAELDSEKLSTATAASTYQPLDSDLTTLAANITAFGHSLVDDANASAAQTTLGLVIGTNVQAYDAELAAIAGLTSAADRLPYFTGSGTASLATFTAAGRNLVDDADASAQRTTLGLGTAATVDVGTSGATIPLLNADNTWSGTRNSFGYSAASGSVLEACLDTDFGAPFTIYSAQASANPGPNVLMRRISASPAANDQGGRFLWQMNDDALSIVSLGTFGIRQTAITAGTCSGRILFQTLQAGALAQRLFIDAGLVVGSPTGNDKGAGAVNAVTLYENGSSLATLYGALASANIFTAAQTVRVDNATTNASTTVATFSHTTTGTPAAGIGVAIDFEAETAAGNNEVGARISARTTDVTAASEDFDVVVSAMAAGAAVTERGRITSKGTYKHQSFTVAGLPAGTAGETCFASNGRKNGEGAGLGTGVLVFHDGTNWCACDTGAAVAA